MTKAIGLLLMLAAGSSSFADEITFSGPGTTANVGDNFSITINAAGITDLYAFQFDVFFNPAVISAMSVTEGTFLAGGGTTFFIPGNIDNLTGVISTSTNSLVGAIPGATGNGMLVIFEFTALAPGTSAISFANGLLLDSSLNDITSNISFVDSSVSINGSSAPEPKTLATLGCGVLTILLIRRVKRANRARR